MNITTIALHYYVFRLCDWCDMGGCEQFKLMPISIQQNKQKITRLMEGAIPTGALLLVVAIYAIYNIKVVISVIKIEVYMCIVY